MVLRKRIVVAKGQRRLFEEDKYLLYLTNLPREEASASQVVRLANGRCGQENLIEQLKNGVQAMRMPSDSAGVKLGLSSDHGPGLGSRPGWGWCNRIGVSEGSL